MNSVVGARRQNREGGDPLDGPHIQRMCTEGTQIRRKPTWFFGPTAEPLRRVCYGVTDIYQHIATLWRFGYTRSLDIERLDDKFLPSEWMLIERCSICNTRRSFDIKNDLICDKCYDRIYAVYNNRYVTQVPCPSRDERNETTHSAWYNGKELHRRDRKSVV